MWEELESQKNPMVSPSVPPTDAWGGGLDQSSPSAPLEGEKPDNFGDLLHGAIQLSMEEMIFLPVEKRAMLIAALAVLEPVRGTIQFIMTPKQARDIAMAIHACDPDALTEKMVSDSAAELINTVAGQLASTLLPTDQTFTLGLPTVLVTGHVEHHEPVCALFMKLADEIFQLVISGKELLALCNPSAKNEALSPSLPASPPPTESTPLDPDAGTLE